MVQIQFGKLQALTIVGYKSIRAVRDLELRDLNIVVGPNGAGKSNLVGLFRLLGRLAREELQDYVAKQGGLNKILHFGPKVTGRMELSFRSNRFGYGCVFEPTAEGTLIFEEEWCSSESARQSLLVPNQFETRLMRDKSSRLPSYVHRTILSLRVYHFHDTSENSRLRSSSTFTEPDRLASDGGNLPAFLYFLQEKHAGILSRIQDAIQLIAPFFGTFVLQPEALNKDLIRLRWRHKGRDEIFDVNDLSDGTLRFIALTALLLQPDPPATIILDEPELGLHPAALGLLAALMQRAAPQVQIIAATQSPTFADQFGWQDFIVADRLDDASHYRRLAQTEVGPWMDEFAMGEIWQKNLIGGRP